MVGSGQLLPFVLCGVSLFPLPLQYCRRQALRLCMKHLRECDYTDAYLSLCKQSRVELEHSLLSQLHSDLVGHGDFLAAERIMQHAAQGFIFV